MIIFETDRLFVRELEEQDLEPFIQINQDPDVMKHIGAPRSREEVIELVKKAQEMYAEKKGFGRWAVIEKASGDYAGSFMLRWSDKISGVELGYSFLKEYWGKGYATELVLSGVEYAFNLDNVGEILAIVEKIHPTSEKVLRKSGFSFLRDYIENGIDLNVLAIRKK